MLKDIAKTHIDKYNYLCSIVFFLCLCFLLVCTFVQLFFFCASVFLLYVPLFNCFYLCACFPLVCAFVLLFSSVCVFSSSLCLYSFILICVYVFLLYVPLFFCFDLCVCLSSCMFYCCDICLSVCVCIVLYVLLL